MKVSKPYDEVYASQLLKCLKATSSQLSLEQIASEAVKVCCFAKTEFIFVVCLDLGQLIADGDVIFW